MEWPWLVRYPSFARIDSIAARSILPIEEVCMSTQANPVLQHGARARRVRDTTRSSAGTNQQSRLTLLFAVLSVVFFLLLIFLRIPSPLYPLMSVQDTIDLLTPLVLIPIYWALFRAATQGQARVSEQAGFMVLAALWVLGQGMHLSANSVDNLTENLAKKQVVDILSTDIYRLTYFYDEVLSHYAWHLGILGLAALLIYAGVRRPASERTSWGWVGTAGVLYGLTNALVFLEGQTAHLGLPFAALATLAVLIWGRKKLREQPILAFLFIAFAVTLALMAVWGIGCGGFPEPMDRICI
jgi:hypothetical protein